MSSILAGTIAVLLKVFADYLKQDGLNVHAKSETRNGKNIIDSPET